MKWIMVTVCGVFLSLLAFAQPASGALKYGVVDVQEVLDSVEEGKKAISEFKSAFETRKDSLEKQQKAYKKMEEDYEKQKLILSPSALQQKQQELGMKREELQRAMISANAEMKKKEMELSANILKKIRSVTEKIGQQKGYDVIYEKNESGLLFYREGNDITKEVVSEYNKAYGKK